METNTPTAMNTLTTETMENITEMIKRSERIYTNKNPLIKSELKTLKKKVRIVNKGLVPYIDKEHTCKTCGSKDGKSHPETSFCFHCDTDNWEFKGNYI